MRKVHGNSNVVKVMAKKMLKQIVENEWRFSSDFLLYKVIKLKRHRQLTA